MTSKIMAFDAIGTHWEIHFNQSIADDLLHRLSTDLQQRAETFDKTYSRFRKDSLVTTLSQQAGSYSLPEDGFAMLQFYDWLYQATGGLVTPLIGQVMVDAGYDADYSFTSRPLKRPPAWNDCIVYDAQHIELTAPVLLDFGAAGKGYLVDILAAMIERAGVENFMINASGDILYRTQSEEAVEIGLENPQDTSEVIGSTRMHNQSLCASAGSKRRWQHFHHIINPTTLQPAEHVIATWVIAADTMTADGLATALFFTPAKELSEKFLFSYAVLHADMSLEHSRDFPLHVFEATSA